jgi:hypothetical protein
MQLVRSQQDGMASFFHACACGVLTWPCPAGGWPTGMRACLVQHVEPESLPLQRQRAAVCGLCLSGDLGLRESRAVPVLRHVGGLVVCTIP